MRTQQFSVMRSFSVGGLVLALTVALSACGQRADESGDTDTDTGSKTETLSVRTLSDVNSISTGGTDVANITALVLDGNNNAVAETDVKFSSSGGVLQDITELSDENGQASATLRLPQDFQNQDIVVTVSAGSSSSSVTVAAEGSVMDVSGPDALVLGDEAEIIASLTAGDGEPISNEMVTVSSSAGNTIEPATITTNADGRAVITVGSLNSSDTIRLSALNGTVNASHSFEVANDVLKFADDARDAELKVSKDNSLLVTWSSQGSNIAGRELLFTTTAGEIVGDSIVTTDDDGKATVVVRSDSAGPAKISVEALDGGSPKTAVDVEFVATTPKTLVLDASTTRVHAGEDSTLVALVTDKNANPVKNQIVNFTSSDLRGGRLNPPSAKTNSSGEASIAFTAGSSATEVNDIEIGASVKGSSIKDSLEFTVVERVLNVTIGTSNELIVKPLGTQYALPFVVQVADGSGTPLENATVNFSIRPLYYSKGSMVLVNEIGSADSTSSGWTADHWGMNQILEMSDVLEILERDDTDEDKIKLQAGQFAVVCDSEDVNLNRLLDVGEDVNDNGSLDPQDPAALTPVDTSGYATLTGGSLTTDQNGSGYLEMLYPASNAMWAAVEITARAEALGAEAEDSFSTYLPLPASEANDAETAPANQYSPYGTNIDCRTTY